MKIEMICSSVHLEEKPPGGVQVGQFAHREKDEHSAGVTAGL